MCSSLCMARHPAGGWHHSQRTLLHTSESLAVTMQLCPRQPQLCRARRSHQAPHQRAVACRASTPEAHGTSSYGLFISSASPEVAEAVGAAGVDWMCLDAQHGAVAYDTLKFMLCATAGSGAKRIVRVGGPTDRFGIQQALDLGADGVMVPLVNSKADAEEAVSYCLFPPDGQRSVAGDTGAVFRRGVGVSVLSKYLQDANKEVEVWLQVETRACYESLHDVLSVPGITCAFLGPADMGFSFGLHVKHGYDLPAMMASQEMEEIYSTVVQACQEHSVQPGVFCLGDERAAQLARLGYTNIGFNTDLGVLVNYTQATLTNLKGGAEQASPLDTVEKVFGGS